MKNKFYLKQIFTNQIFRSVSAYAVLLALSCNLVFAETGVTLNLKDADIRSFIETVAEATGRNFIVDPRVKAKVTVSCCSFSAKSGSRFSFGIASAWLCSGKSW